MGRKGDCCTGAIPDTGGLYYMDSAFGLRQPARYPRMARLRMTALLPVFFLHSKSKSWQSASFPGWLEPSVHSVSQNRVTLSIFLLGALHVYPVSYPRCYLPVEGALFLGAFEFDARQYPRKPMGPSLLPRCIYVLKRRRNIATAPHIGPQSISVRGIRIAWQFPVPVIITIDFMYYFCGPLLSDRLNFHVEVINKASSLVEDSTLEWWEPK